MTREGIPEDKQSFAREMDLRYAGQSFELKVPVPADSLKPEHLSSLEAAFHQYHERAYGHSTPGEPVEMVNLRVTAKGIIPKPKMKQLAKMNGHGGNALKGVREVCFHASEGFRSTPIYERYKLLAGEELAGPAIVEEFDSTVVIHPGYRASVDRFASLHIVRE